MAESILKKIGTAVKNLVDTTRTELQASITAITPTSLGLGNVDNTSDVNKPISTATQSALDTKQNIDAAMVFDGSYVHTDNNYTTTEKTKLSGIEDGATADQTAPEILTLVKTVDGSGSGLDADLLDGQEGAYYTNYTDTKIAALVASSPATMDTLNELASALGNDPNFATTVATQIGTKLDASTYTASDVLTKVKTVDGAGSGLDADLLDGQQGSYYQPASTALTTSTNFSGDASGTYNTLTVSRAAKLTTARTIGLSGDVVGSVSFDGSANSTIASTLANSGVTAGSYGSATNIPVITFDSKGRATSASTVAVSIPSGAISVTGGDLTMSGNTGTAITNATLVNTGVTAGTYRSVTVDAKGRVTGGTNPTTPFDVCQFINGKPFSSESVVKIIAPRAISIPANMTGSYFRSGTAATASTVLTVYKNGVSAGTVTFAAGSTSGTVSTSTISLVAGDMLTMVAPPGIDATFADFVCTITGTM